VIDTLLADIVIPDDQKRALSAEKVTLINDNHNLKVGVIYTISPPISIQKLDQWLGIWSLFFEELLLTF
jgi:hypothetical protein